MANVTAFNLTTIISRATRSAGEVDEMVGKHGAGPRHSATSAAIRPDAEPDVAQFCPNCGARGEWQKCKLICLNPRCSVRIILACVD